MLREVQFSGFDSAKLLSTFLTLSTNIPMEIIGGDSTTCKIRSLKMFVFFHYFAYVLQVLLQQSCKLLHVPFNCGYRGIYNVSSF